MIRSFTTALAALVLAATSLIATGASITLDLTTLPAGKTLTLEYDTTVQALGGDTSDLSTKATITHDGGIVETSDPATPAPAPNDPTLTVVFENAAPIAGSLVAGSVGAAEEGFTSYDFTVDYSDDGAVTNVDVSTIDIADVTVTGPGGALTVTAGSEPSGIDGTPKTATYTVTPPGGSWDSADNGTYTIAMVASQVSDIGSGPPLSVAAGTLGTFDVNVPDPSYTIVAADADKLEGSTGTTAFTFTVNRGGDTSVAGSVDFAITGADAADFSSPLTGTIPFPAATASVPLTVQVVGDTDLEGDEAFSVTLSNPTPFPGTVIGMPASAGGTIQNDDATFAIAATDAGKLEGNSGNTGFTFTVTRSGYLADAASVNFAVTGSGGDPADAADFGGSLPSGTANFAAADATQLITVNVSGDTDLEADEGFTVTLSNSSGPGITTSSDSGLIGNDDALTVEIAATDTDADENTPDPGNFRVSRNSSSGALLVQIQLDPASTATPAADFGLSGVMLAGGAGSVTIPDGSTFLDIALNPVDDVPAEAAETAILQLVADPGYVSGSSTSGTVTIAANDFVVTNANDFMPIPDPNGGEGTLRQAILNANALGGSPTITFSDTGGTPFSTVPQTIVLVAGQLQFTNPAAIDGPMMPGWVTLDAGGANRVVDVTSAAAGTSLSKLTITGGMGVDNGTGILANGDTTVSFCVIEGNTANFSGGGIRVGASVILNIRNSIVRGNGCLGGGGAGIDCSNGATVRMRSCTVTDNEGGNGGGIQVFNANLVAVNSTISGNRANRGGGGISLAQPGSTAVLDHVTIVGNHADFDQTGDPPHVGGGIRVVPGASCTVNNSIVAGNILDGAAPAPSDIHGAVVATSGYNLIGVDSDLTGITDGTDGNQIGTSGSPLDPQLGPLADNGGPTLTHALLAGSPAIDMGDPAFDPNSFMPPLANDQRGPGFPRVLSTAVDIGAFELLSVDIALSTTDSPDPVVAGSDTLTYVVTVENIGPLAATGVEISEALTLPSGVTVQSITPSAGTTYAPPDAAAGTWTVGSLASSASATLTVVLDISASTAEGTDSIGSTATVTNVNEPDANLANDTSTENSSVIRRVDLQVSKIDTPDPVTAGSGASNLTHTVTVTNAGPSDASGVALSEVVSLPAGASIVSITPSGATTYAPTDSSPGSWTVGNLAFGASETLTIVMTVDASTADGAIVSDTATLTAVNETLITTGDDTATEDTTVQRRVDLLVSKIDTPDPVTAGSGASNLTHVVTVTNAGPSDASGVTLSETVSLPAGASIVSITPSGATNYAPSNTSPGSWTVGNLAAGASETLTVVMTVGAATADGAIISDTATLTAVNETLINTGDDNATEDTTVQRRVDLQVSKIDTPDPVTAGSGASNLTHTVTVTNAGPSDASGVALSETVTLPAGASIVSITPSGTTGYAPTNTSPGSWTVGNLAAGASETLTIVMTVDDSTADGAIISDTATLTAANETLISTGDDSATETTTVQRRVDLQVSRTDTPDPLTAGSGAGNLTHTVAVTNVGPSNASGVTLSENLTLPAGASIVSITPSGTTSYAPTNISPGTWTVGELAAGASETLTIVITVGATTADGATVSGTATLTAANETLINTGDDSATEDTTVAREFDIALTQTESIDPVLAGSGPGNLVYVVTATNNGPSDAGSVQIDEVLTLPAGVTIDSIVESSGAYVGGATGTWSLPTLATGGSETLTITLTAAASAPNLGTIVSTATLTGATGTDTVPGNNSVTENTGILAGVDLVVTGMESADPVTAGSGPGNLVYTIDVTNNGPLAATGVELTSLLTLPVGTTAASIVPSSGIHVPSDPVNGVWMLGNLGVGATETLTITLDVGSSTAVGTDTVGAMVAVSAVTEPQINTGDEIYTETTSVERAVDLVVSVDESVETVAAGSGLPGNLVHTVTVTNNGPSDASGVSLNVGGTFPGGVTLDSTMVDAGSFAMGIWDGFGLASGASATLTRTFSVAATASGGIDVIITDASVAGAGEPLVLTGDDSDSEASSIISPADVGTFEIDVDPVLNLQSGLFDQRVRVTNNNPLPIAGFRLLVHNLPADVTLYNAQGDIGGVPFVDYNNALAAGATVELALEFFRPSLDPNFDPVYEVVEVFAEDPVDPPVAPPGFSIDRAVLLGNGDFMIEFTATPGNEYAIEYSADLATWKRAVPSIIAPANKVQWIDNGPPKTERRLPAMGRFYRVVLVAIAP